MRTRSMLIGYALARSLPLAALGGTWSFSASLGRYAGTLAAAVMYLLCLLLIRTRSIDEREQGKLPLSRTVPPCVFAVLSGLRTAGGPAGMLLTVLTGLADSTAIASLSGFGLRGAAMGILYLPSAVAGLIVRPQLPLPIRAAAEIIESACPAGLAVCAAERDPFPLSSGGLIAGLVLGLGQNIVL